ncbi:Uncharacterised protein [Haemophilus influenzae]|nr:hypothetical protein BV043_01311 [Haemophilus influenzae]PRK57852.1 hypothetical protein BV190_00408 [Haemophilus influenzae]PRL75791.1 hypothetical protein BV044_01177 [Haemophilus influenzae]CWX59681.1 Uncharacterised protein [Haemophilus influenzae]CWX70719.1 Uncharacterised protein [Haemophilus influenzae]
MVLLVSVDRVPLFFLGLLDVPSPVGNSVSILLSWSRERDSSSIVTLSGSSSHSFVLVVALSPMDK